MKLKESNGLQNEDELKWYAKFSIDLGVRKYLEIGTNGGNTMYAILANSPYGSLGVSIDVNSNIFNTVKEELKDLGYLIHTLEGDSKDVSIIQEAKVRSPYDLVFIDGDHSYTGVKSDWSNYGSLAPVIVFHDTGSETNQPDVHKFWQELKQGKRCLEYNLANTHGYGVIYN